MACTETGEYAFVLVRFRTQYLQCLKNSLNTNLSILKRYDGEIKGIGENVQLIEGEWPADKMIAVIMFSTRQNAFQWYQSAPMVKQPDWLNGADVVIVRLKSCPCPAPGDSFLQIQEFRVRDKDVFDKSYLPAISDIVRKAGASPEVVSTCQIKKIRGLWDIGGHLIINQWGADHDFRTYNEQRTTEELRTLRQQSVDSRYNVYFKLERTT